MIFPNDYLADQEIQAYLKLVKLDNFKNGVGIIDGGIVDNQVIGSMVNFDKSSQEGFPLDLLIVNDVDGNKMPPWEKFQPSANSSEKESFASLANRYLGYLQMKPIYWIGLIIGILGLFGFHKLA